MCRRSFELLEKCDSISNLHMEGDDALMEMAGASRQIMPTRQKCQPVLSGCSEWKKFWGLVTKKNGVICCFDSAT